MFHNEGNEQTRICIISPQFFCSLGALWSYQLELGISAMLCFSPPSASVPPNSHLRSISFPSNSSVVGGGDAGVT